MRHGDSAIRTLSAMLVGSSLCLMTAAIPARAEQATTTPGPGPQEFFDKDLKLALQRGQRSYLGVGVADIDEDRADHLKLKEEYGVEVTTVAGDSPAEKSGLRAEDVVLEYNGTRVEGTEQFVRLVHETPPGRKVKLLIGREGKTQTVSVVLGERKDLVIKPFSGAEFDWKGSMDALRVMPDLPKAFTSWRNPVLGIEAESLGPQLAEYFGVKEGVLVRSVILGSAAEKAGLKAGDVITRVEGRAVTTPAEVSSAILGELPRKSVNLSIRRNQKDMTVTVALDEKAEFDPAGFGPGAVFLSVPAEM